VASKATTILIEAHAFEADPKSTLMDFNTTRS
jgi:hypothetical protein